MDVREKLVELLKGSKLCSKRFDDQYSDGTIAIIADHLIAHGVTVQEWIPVTERLPKNFSTVIGYEPGNRIGEVNYEDEEFEWADDEKLAFVTHWMPLPKPPKGE